LAIPQLAVDLPGMPANMNGGARLRFVMEDPAQLLSNAVASYIIDHLCANGNQPTDGMRHDGSSEVGRSRWFPSSVVLRCNL
jgi:hypothetical protein